MLSQYTAGALVCENRVLSNPAAAGSIPAAADQEDFVSMGMTTAIKTRQIIENCWQVIAIELMAAAQAFDFRAPVRPAPELRPHTKLSVSMLRNWKKTGRSMTTSTPWQELSKRAKCWKR